MKIHSILFLFLLVMPAASWGQYSSGNKLSLTIYGNIFQKNQEIQFLNLTNGQISDKQESVQGLQFGDFSPALFILHSNQHFSEIELSFLRFNQEDVVRVTELSGPFPGTTQAFSLGVRYAINFNSLVGQKSVVQPHFGLSVLPYMHRVNTNPENKALYKTTQTNLGVLGQFISRLIIQLSDFIYLDLNLPISILEAKQQTMRLQDGGQNLPDIKESKTDLRWLPKKTHLRIGVGVAF